MAIRGQRCECILTQKLAHQMHVLLLSAIIADRDRPRRAVILSRQLLCLAGRRPRSSRRAPCSSVDLSVQWHRRNRTCGAARAIENDTSLGRGPSPDRVYGLAGWDCPGHLWRHGCHPRCRIARRRAWPAVRAHPPDLASHPWTQWPPPERAQPQPCTTSRVLPSGSRNQNMGGTGPPKRLT